MTNTLPTVTARGVLAATRAIFMLAAATLAPLLAQYLFGARVGVGSWALFAVAGAIASLALAPRGQRRWRCAPCPPGVLPRRARGRGHGRAQRGCRSSALALPIVSRSARSSAPSTARPRAAFGAAFALWTRRARAALARPSALASQRLAMEAGLALARSRAPSAWRRTRSRRSRSRRASWASRAWSPSSWRWPASCACSGSSRRCRRRAAVMWWPRARRPPRRRSSRGPLRSIR